MAEPSSGPVGAELIAELTDFTFSLRLAGLAVTIDRSMSFLRAVALLDSVDQVQLFWAGRSTLCSEPGDFDIYDDTFNWFFRHTVPAEVRPEALPRPLKRLTVVDNGAGTERASERVAVRHKDLADLSADEREELAALLRLLDPNTSQRRGSRRAPTRRGHPEPERPIRAMVRGGGDVVTATRRAFSSRPRKLVLLIDVSHSMAPYADPLLRFAHSAKRRLGNGCEVFSLGTALTRLSAVLAEPDSRVALDAAAQAVADWSGGTRLGQALRSFLDQHGQRGMARGSVVIVFSDGWERGSAELLAEQARRLSRLTRSLIWVNPDHGGDGSARVQSGIAAVQPFCDHLLAGQSLTALGELMDIARDA